MRGDVEGMSGCGRVVVVVVVVVVVLVALLLPDECVVCPSLDVWHSLQIHLLLLAHLVFEGVAAPRVDAVHAATHLSLTHGPSRREFAARTADCC